MPSPATAAASAGITLPPCHESKPIILQAWAPVAATADSTVVGPSMPAVVVVSTVAVVEASMVEADLTAAAAMAAADANTRSPISSIGSTLVVEA